MPAPVTATVTPKKSSVEPIVMQTKNASSVGTAGDKNTKSTSIDDNKKPVNGDKEVKET
jgi:hypothetical protein